MVTMEKLLEIVGSTGLVDDMGKYDASKTFKANDIDSLDVMTVLLAIEEAVGVKFSEEESNDIRSLNDVLAALEARGS